MVQVISLPRNESGIETAIAILKQRFGERLQTGQAIREQHGHTTTWIENQPPDAVVFAQSTADVAEVVRIAAEHRVPIIPFGTGTSLEGHVNAPAGGISIDVSQMNRILKVHSEDLDVVVQPGVTRKALNEYLRDTGLFFPIDPGADASLGGMAATRASGTNAVRYGTMKDNVLALEAVLPSGEIVRTGGRARKSSAGYDLTRLLVGSEGTLGIITELTLRLYGIPEAMSSARCTFPDVESACNAVILTIQIGVPVARMELLDAESVAALNDYAKLDMPVSPLLLLEFHGSDAGVAEQAETFGEIAEEVGGTGFDWTANAEERTRLWQARHDAYWALKRLRPEAEAVATDVCVPISNLAEAVTRTQTKAAELNLLCPIIGHVGDGNYHCTLLIDMKDNGERARCEEFVTWLSSLAVELDGTISGEHGIGQGKIASLPKEAPTALSMMRAVKQAIDPQNIMNPGKILKHEM
ncbi:MAG: FAD-linked oxidase C-terminal domain-containing protein [Pseudomonadota bacterium]